MKIKSFFLFSVFIIFSLSFVHAAEDSAGSSVQIGLPEEQPPVVNPPSGGNPPYQPPIEVPPEEEPEEEIPPLPGKELEPELEKPSEELAPIGIIWDFWCALILIILLLIIIWLLLDRRSHNRHYHRNQTIDSTKDNVLKQKNTQQ